MPSKIPASADNSVSFSNMFLDRKKIGECTMETHLCTTYEVALPSFDRRGTPNKIHCRPRSKGLIYSETTFAGPMTNSAPREATAGRLSAKTTSPTLVGWDNATPRALLAVASFKHFERMARMRLLRTNGAHFIL
jgi:hypothetical protein